jgi:nucleoid-associated protein YgaU
VKLLCSLFLILLFSGGCAQPPLAELAAARGALAEAYAAGASRLAAGDYQVAARATQDSEVLVHDGNYQEARQLLPFATRRARRATVLARAADEQLRRAEMEHRDRVPAQPQRQQVLQANPSTRATPPLSPPPPKPVPLQQSSYTVENGETLWTIAAQPRVYNDPLLWPLLYKANRDQIRDPRRVYSGQVLSIPRDLSPAEIEEARQAARGSDIFPVNPVISIPPAAVPR